MRKKIFAVVLAALQIFCVGCAHTTEEASCVRLCVQADSRAPAAARLGHEVEATVSVYLSDLTAGDETYESAYRAMKASTDAVQAIAERVLRRNGCGYAVRVTLTRRTYAAAVIEGIVLPGGAYDALVVVVGAGAGETYGGIAYPRAEVSARDGAVYRSLIREALSHR